MVPCGIDDQLEDPNKLLYMIPSLSNLFSIRIFEVLCHNCLGNKKEKRAFPVKPYVKPTQVI